MVRFDRVVCLLVIFSVMFACRFVCSFVYLFLILSATGVLHWRDIVDSLALGDKCEPVKWHLLLSLVWPDWVNLIK